MEGWIARMNCIVTSGTSLMFAAIKIKHAKSPIALRIIRAHPRSLDS
jgi:hypothetical protein